MKEQYQVPVAVFVFKRVELEENAEMSGTDSTDKVVCDF